MKKIIPVILCGGSGTRLWPASRKSYPKQFLMLTDGVLSSFQQTLKRVSDATRFEEPIIITDWSLRFLALHQMGEIGVKGQLIAEPEGRDSAAAVCAAAVLSAQKSDDAAVLVLAADHIMLKPDAFLAACDACLEAVHNGSIVTFGISPDFPATGYGYISPQEKTTAVTKVGQFIEKPNADAAQDYIAKGYLWNSGNFMFKASTMKNEFAQRHPEILAQVEQSVAHATEDAFFLALDDTYKAIQRISLDYAIMEKTDKASVIAVDLGWSDIGNWNAIYDLSAKDDNQNVTKGSTSLLNSKQCYVQSHEDVLTTVVGCDNLAVITTRDAVMVANRDNIEDVKLLVSQLKTEKQRQAEDNLRCYRPWGWYQTLDLGARFQVKRIVVYPGGRLSLQKHHHRAEHWVVVSGTAEVQVNERVEQLIENQSIYIPLGAVHRLTNPGKINLELIEVQSGSYLGEDDIVRLEDVYSRKSSD